MKKANWTYDPHKQTITTKFEGQKFLIKCFQGQQQQESWLYAITWCGAQLLGRFPSQFLAMDVAVGNRPAQQCAIL